MVEVLRRSNVHLVGSFSNVTSLQLPFRIQITKANPQRTPLGGQSWAPVHRSSSVHKLLLVMSQVVLRPGSHWTQVLAQPDPPPARLWGRVPSESFFGSIPIFISTYACRDTADVFCCQVKTYHHRQLLAIIDNNCIMDPRIL